MRDVTFTRRFLGKGVSARADLVRYKGQTACMKTVIDEQSVENPLQLFTKEAEILYHLNGAGSAPRLYAVGKDKPVLIMEFVKGVTLKEILKTKNGKKKCNVYAILTDTAHHLNVIHDKNYTHNDVHSENIIVCDVDKEECKKFKVRLIDFGLSTMIKELNTEKKSAPLPTFYKDTFSIFRLVSTSTQDISSDQIKQYTSRALDEDNCIDEGSTPIQRVISILTELGPPDAFQGARRNVSEEKRQKSEVRRRKNNERSSKQDHKKKRKKRAAKRRRRQRKEENQWRMEGEEKMENVIVMKRKINITKVRETVETIKGISKASHKDRPKLSNKLYMTPVMLLRILTRKPLSVTTKEERQDE
ncbi:hypothetical protein Pmani_011885 [Petrolisthes manimaculis]|uniref:Protein kinase domain-containing protein n=1 Tax=Petrolisthes manimaculis TaxID=1843537 RepID=A0AAE1UFN2_9EUCA|nr:hypothetical protein Pmani_011885 [Petrolisthes manimaculis]